MGVFDLGIPFHPQEGSGALVHREPGIGEVPSCVREGEVVHHFGGVLSGCVGITGEQSRCLIVPKTICTRKGAVVEAYESTDAGPCYFSCAVAIGHIRVYVMQTYEPSDISATGNIAQRVAVAYVQVVDAYQSADILAAACFHVCIAMTDRALIPARKAAHI